METPLMSWQKQHEHVTARDLPSYPPHKMPFFLLCFSEAVTDTVAYDVPQQQHRYPWWLDSAPATPQAAGTAPDSQNGLTQQRSSGWILGP